ncbi:MAG: hypothetical protein OER88_08970 [Planctomycetota bacterium]|nr:hypothetical protein [Planctomycetota bacterium]
MSERRSADRLKLNGEIEGRVEFGYPNPAGHACEMKIRDISASGIGFLVDEELPGLEVGRILEGVTVRIGRRSVRGDLVVMHLTDGRPTDAFCGAMFCPTSDEDILRLREVLHELRSGQDDRDGEAA